MNQIKLLLFSFLALVLFANYSFGSHVSGGNISYIYTGVPNTYQVTLSLYRDCSGINAPSQGGTGHPFVNFTNNCGHPDQLVEFPNQLIQEISALDTTYCPDLSTCLGGSLPGMQLLQYQATVTLAPCNSWTVSYSLAARNPSVNTGGGNFYIETIMNTATNATNTSPSIQWSPNNGFDPIPYGCVGSLKAYAPNVVEPDGDSIVFSLVGALGGPGAPIVYTNPPTPPTPPISGTNPISGITIDPNTGLLTFTANMAGNYVITILIEE